MPRPVAAQVREHFQLVATAGAPALPAAVAAVVGLSAARGLLLSWGLPSLPLGLAYGVALLGIVRGLGRWPAAQRPMARAVPALGLGVVVGASLLLPGFLLARAGLLPAATAQPAGAFVPWAAVVTFLTVAEEALFRGALQPRLAAALGAERAVVALAVLFAAIHVPVYGPAALPLDLGVGLLLGWLRLATGRVGPAIVAHAIADLGGWFLP